MNETQGTPGLLSWLNGFEYPTTSQAGASTDSSRPWWANLLVATGMFALNGLTNTLNAGNVSNPYSQPTAQFNVINLLLIGGLIYFIAKK
jgi:hypothetical protein